MTVYEAILNVTAELGAAGISKDKRNTTQNYAFRGIEDVYKALNPALVSNGLVILPRVLSRHTEAHENRNGTLLFYTRLHVAFDLVSTTDGTSHTVETYGEAMDSGDKGHNKAMSAAYKYMAFLTFCIPTEGLQEDTEEASPEVVPTENDSVDEALRAACRDWVDAIKNTHKVTVTSPMAVELTRAVYKIATLSNMVVYLTDLHERLRDPGSLSDTEKKILNVQ